MTTNRELFEKDPTSFVLPNDGVSKVGTPSDAKQWDVLRFELESFVCEGEYAEGLQRILDSYLRNADRSTQPAVWVSGFYGSGKSHLIRVLEHLWRNTTFPDGASARSLVASLPQQLRDALRELDTVARRSHTTPWAAAGSLDAAGTQHLNEAVLAIAFQAAGLPQQVAPARVMLWLRAEGLADGVSQRLENIGKNLTTEARQFHLSVPLAQAIIGERPDLAETPRELLQNLKAQFTTSALTTADTVEWFRSAVTSVSGGTMPPTLIVVDEVQQYINDNSERALHVQGLVQALSSQFAGRVLVVATGQQELTANPELQKIQDRFSVKVHLRNQDVDEVVRRVLLQKKPSQIAALTATLERASGEIGRELDGSGIRHGPSDDEQLVRDYPLLPSRRRFWESVLREADQGGRAGQLRSQLRVVHEAVRQVAADPVGTVVGADFLYDDKNADMNAAGKLLRDVQVLIATQAEHRDDGPLRARILATLQLISLLPTSGAAAIGVRPTATHVADLLVRALESDGGWLRSRVPELLDALAREAVVQQDGQQFVIQTAVGREWEQDFRGKRAALAGNAAEFAAVRNESLKHVVREQLPRQIVQGRSKVPRRLEAHFGPDAPDIADRIPVWVQTWSDLGSRQFSDLTRGADHATPVVYVYLDRVRPDELRDALLDRQAAHQVVQTRATPTTDEGRQAKRAMESRLTSAEQRTEALISEVIEAAKVELAGGAAGDGSSFPERVSDAAGRAARRLFAEFSLADDPRWKDVVGRLKDGNDQPLSAVGYSDTVDRHPAVAKILAAIGPGGIDGNALRDTFQAPPYGWSLDAIHGAIGALVAGGFIGAEINGQPAEPKAVATLTATRMGSLRVRREAVALNRMDTINARGQAGRLLGRDVSANESLPTVVRQALDRIAERANGVSGPPPFPSLSLPDAIHRLDGRAGNDLVKAFLDANTDVEAYVAHLRVLERRLSTRKAALDLADGLAGSAGGVSAAEPAISRLREFEATRELLADDDHVSPIVQDLAGILRAEITKAATEYSDALAAAVSRLDTDPAWHRLGEDDHQRILRENSLVTEAQPQLGDPQAVLTELRRRPLVQWAAMRDAVPSRVARALETAVKITAPRAVPIGVPGGSIGSDAELESYLAQLRKRLADALREHGVIVVRAS